MKIRYAGTLWLLLTTLAAPAATAGAWPQLRGPGLDGRSPETGLLASDFALETAWKHPLGMGYSAVSVAGGKAVTLFSDGEHDVAVAWDAASGRELWRTVLAETYRGHDGSTDGPVGTPTLDGERVYAVGPRGDFVALDLADGRILWSRHLEEDFGSEAPVYGFSPTPVVAGDLVILQTGGPDGRSVSALDRRTGETRWSVGEDRITHQSPIWIDTPGERLLISVGTQFITALRPADGRLLWSRRHSDGPLYDPTYPQAVPLDDGGIALAFANEVVRYRLTGDGVEELWRSRGFKGSSAVPVEHDGYLYGFNGRFLSCLDAADGEVVWKSRPPGGRGLILVDGHLLILGSGGWLTAVEASPEGYREKARVRVSEQGGYTAPSFAEGRIYVRNLAAVASVRVVRDRDDHAAGETIAGPGDGAFASWARGVERAANPAEKKRRIDELLSGGGSFPIIEDGRRVHFVYRGPAEGVSLIGQMQADSAVPEPMRRIPGTDFFYRSYELEPDGRWQYRLQVDFEDPVPDPLNPHRALGEPVATSELVMPGFRDPDHVESDADAPPRLGRLEELELEGPRQGQPIKVPVYLPAGYDDAAASFPLLVVPNGEQWLEAGLKSSLDHLFGRVARPAIVAFAPISSWVGGQWGDPAKRWIAERLLPRLDRTFRVDTTAGSTALWTVQEKAAIAFDLVREQPQRFGRVALQSPRTYRGELPPLGERRERDLRFFVSWSRYESRSAEGGIDERRMARDLRDWLEGLGYPVRGGEMVAGPGFRTWRRQAEEILGFLLPR